MTQRTTRGTIAAGVAAWLLLLAIVAWRAQSDEATQDQADADAARLEEIARDSEDEVFSLRDATGATGDLPAFYEQQWVPLIGVLAPAREQKARRAEARKATNEELERARAANTALQERLREMAEYEARAQEVEP